MKSDSVPMQRVLASSSIMLVPNGLDDQASRYSVRSVTGFRGQDKEYGEEVDGKVVMVEFERQPTCERIPCSAN